MSLVIIVLLNVAVQWWFFRWDMTTDRRYSVSEATQTMLRSLDKPVSVTLYLDGSLNAGFLRLRNAMTELLDELGVYADIAYKTTDPQQLTEKQQQALQQSLLQKGYRPTAIYETDKDGRQLQTIVYPYALVEYDGRTAYLNLLQNNRQNSGAENLNHSIEALEYTFAEGLATLAQKERYKVAFLEGHGELPEQSTMDLQTALAQYFDIYRGAITTAGDCLDAFRVVIVADPQEPFTDEEKYVLDQYLMRGGRILWVMNGVRFSENVLTDEGYTPVIPLDLNLTDMLFRYGIRINPRLVQDVQCLPIPVDISTGGEPQYQPMPWYYAPLLLTSYGSPITRNLMQVSATFASDLEFVGDGEGQEREVLLATSNASRLIGTPAEVNLSDLHADLQLFQWGYVPVGASIRGVFHSLYAHLAKPEAVQDERTTATSSAETKQVFVAAGSAIRNEWQNGQPLPLGYDRYSKVQFGNRDFFVNAVLYLSDDTGIISLRQKTMRLRMLNDKAVRQKRAVYQAVSIGLPLLLLAIAGAAVVLIRKKKYQS